MQNADRILLSNKKIAGDFHIKRKVFGLALLVVMAMIAFGLIIGESQTNSYQSGLEYCAFLLLLIIVVLSIFVFRSITKLFHTYFKLKENKCVIVPAIICDKSVYNDENGNIWIQTDVLEKPIFVGKNTYKNVHRGDRVFIVFVDNKVIKVYSAKNYRLKSKEYNQKKGKNNG